MLKSLWLAILLLGMTPLAQAEAIAVRGYLSRDKVATGQVFRVAVVLDLPAPWHVNANPASSPESIPTTLTFEPNPHATVGPVMYPRGKVSSVPWADEPVALYSGPTIILADVTVTGPTTLVAVLKYQACDDKVCYAPKQVAVPLPIEIGVAGLPVHSEIFSLAGESVGDSARREARPPVADHPPVTTRPPAAIEDLLARRGWVITLVVVFLGGLALNLTPCVYPMIAITVSYFGGQTRTVGVAFRQSLVYFMGVTLTYSVLGLVAALTGGLFGALLQNGWVLVSIAALLAALALSMFGLYEIQPPQFLLQRATGLSARAGYLGVFFLGTTVGVIAAPCLAPVLVALLAYVGQRGDPWLGWWLFFVLACGLGLPYVVLGTFSGLLTRLPKSGMWMVWVKRIFGVVLIGAAAWVLMPLWKSKGVSWPAYTDAAIRQAAAKGQPVIIDFSAAWCGECLEMERTTFRDPRVIAAGQSFTLLQADLSNDESPAVKALTAQYHILGLPTLIFLDPTGREHAELRQVGYVKADWLLGVLERARQPAATNTLDSVGSVPLQLLQ